MIKKSPPLGRAPTQFPALEHLSTLTLLLIGGEILAGFFGLDGRPPCPVLRRTLGLGWH